MALIRNHIIKCKYPQFKFGDQRFNRLVVCVFSAHQINTEVNGHKILTFINSEDLKHEKSTADYTLVT